MNSKKLIIILLIVTAIIVTVAVVGKKQGKFGKAAASKVSVEKAALRDIIEVVTASGKIYPETEVKISPDVSGEIVELFVEEGDTVKKGQLLARIRPDSYQAMLEQTDANVNNAKANLSNMRARLKQVEAQLDGAKLAYNRAKELYAKKTISKSEYENAETNMKSLESELDATKESIEAAKFLVQGAEAAKAESRNNLNKTTIYSPMDGIVSVLNVEEGEKVVGTLQMSGTEMMRIADFGDMEVRIDVSEAEITKVREGQDAVIEVDAYPGKWFRGFVTQVSSSSKGSSGFGVVSNDQASNFVVKVRIDRSSYEDLQVGKTRVFRPGMSATVDIHTSHVDSAITIPVQAVTTREDTTGNSSEPMEIVFLVNEDKAVMKQVSTGIQNDQYIQILEGVKVGDAVVTAPYGLLSRDLKNGSAVKVVSKEELFGLEEDK